MPAEYKYMHNEYALQRHEYIWTVSGQELFLVVARSECATWNALPTELLTATVCLQTVLTLSANN